MHTGVLNTREIVRAIEERADLRQNVQFAALCGVASIKASICATAQAQVAMYPQYVGYFQEKGWRLARITEHVVTTGGVAAQRGDFVIARKVPTFADFPQRYEFWSIAHAVTTALAGKQSIDWMEDEA